MPRTRNSRNRRGAVAAKMKEPEVEVKEFTIDELTTESPKRVSSSRAQLSKWQTRLNEAHELAVKQKAKKDRNYHLHGSE